MIDRATIDKIYSSADIVEVISDFVTLKKKGVNYQACCPFHNEKTPSFVVSPSKGVFKCFGCGKGGNAITFVMEHEGVSYVDALKYVAKKYGIEVQERELSEEEKRENDDRESMMVVTSYANDYFKKSLRETEEGRNIGMSYFRERGFGDAIIDKFGLGYCPAAGSAFSDMAVREGYKEDFLVRTGLTIKRESGGYYDRFAGRVMFPVHSLSGRVIAFGGRTLRTDKKTAKYLNSPESEIYHKSNTLYGIYFAKKAITQQNFCILVEGYFDVLSMVQSGVENVVASSGTSLTSEQIRLISRFTKNITVIYDGDAAGIKASIRGIDMILKEGLNVRVVLMPEGEDPDSFAQSHSSEELSDYIRENEVDFISFKTNLLLSEVKNDPIGRAAMITDIVGSIAVIPDEIVRSQYIRECSRLTDSDEQMIAREVMRRRVDMLEGSAGREVLQNMERKESYKRRKQQEEEEQSLLAERIKESMPSPTDELERELVVYLLKYGNKDFYFQQHDAQGHNMEPVELNVAQTIIEELEIDNIEFRNTVYKSIYDEYVKMYKMREELVASAKEGDEPVERVSINEFINNPVPAVCDFVVDILTKDDAYRASKIWSKFDDVVLTEEDNLNVAVPKAIAVYKLRVIGEITRSLLEEIKGADEDTAMEILHKIKALDDSRKIICEKYSRIL
ncbi:MAG TPA: DNA primase [Candidatus Avirikenella pullistercoris]|nr:DNA primase [Candidatus Avirikenella pullistercoris]